VDNRCVSGAVVEDRRTGAHHTIRCGLVVAAAGPFHTPQLLWASGIRLAALGRYLNVHPQVVATVSTGLSSAAVEPPQADDRAHLRAIYWVPFNDLGHPWHGQVLVAAPPCGGSAIVGLAWYVPKVVDSNCRVQFADCRRDARGLPAPLVVHTPTATDRRMTAQALSLVTRVATAIGPYVADGAPRVLVSGKSLHYQGTTRMGTKDDGTSVCDPTGRVWGIDGLYVAGPNVIPTATACNPTLTAVALATITADRIVRALVTC
jgi:choline dehydrogenase-like flavoprotein